MPPSTAAPKPRTPSNTAVSASEDASTKDTRPSTGSDAATTDGMPPLRLRFALALPRDDRRQVTTISIFRMKLPLAPRTVVTVRDVSSWMPSSSSFAVISRQAPPSASTRKFACALATVLPSLAKCVP